MPCTSCFHYFQKTNAYPIFEKFLELKNDGMDFRFSENNGKVLMKQGTMARLFTECDVVRGILKFPCKIWEFRATLYSINSQAIIAIYV